MTKTELKNLIKEVIIEHNTKSELIEKIGEYIDYMIASGLNIEPLPSIELKYGDKENAANFFGRTAFYDFENKHIRIYCEGRHPRDIVRSLSHELIHHMQNLEGRLVSVEGTNTNEDGNLNDLEAEANLKGTMTFRNWSDSVKYKDKNNG